MKILSWNVNGIRSVHKKGFLDWFWTEDADIVCVQETKASPEQIPDDLHLIRGYTGYFSRPEKLGYSGVGLWSRIEPKKIDTSIGIGRFDNEGRVIRADYEKCILFNVYFPNGKASDERLEFKMDFYETFLALVTKLKKQGKKIIVCGDVNTAHKEIDLARPKENEMISGFLPQERAWMDRFIEAGFIDTFRMFNTEGENYTWWSMRTNARKRNVGWRIDYFFVSENLKSKVTSATIQSEIHGSDHCPIAIEINL